MNKNNGYILILTLLILSILVIVVTGNFYLGTSHQILTKTWLDREKAKMLAISGIHLALSKLILPKEKQAEEKKKINEKEKMAVDEKSKIQLKVLAHILPILNNWQVVKLKNEIDGVDGEIRILIGAEDGKININKIYDFATHKFIAQDLLNIQKIFEELNKRIKPLINNKDFMKGLQEFLSKRKYPLNDVTELILIPEFSYFEKFIFYEPPLKQSESEKIPIFLNDIFTIWTDKIQIQPLLFSNSILTILGLKRLDNNINVKKKKIEELIKNFKPNFQWSADWNKILKPFYEKDFASLPKGMELMLETGFDPSVFSVISYGTVGEVTQKIYAILQKKMINNETTFEVKKLYWI